MKLIPPTLLLLFAWFTLQAQLPNVNIQNIDKEWVLLSDLKGEELTVVDFWATWCKPCVTSIPKLNKLYEEFSEKGVEFIGINVDAPRSVAKVKPFASSLNINYSIVLDTDQELVSALNVNVFPTMIIFNNMGEEVFVHEGFNLGDEALIRNELLELLKE